MKNRRGFSLIEMTVAVALIGAVSAVAAPSVYDATDYNDVMTVKRMIVTHFASAQSSAVQRGRQVSVHIENDSIWIAVVKAAGDSAITAKKSLTESGANVQTNQPTVIYDSRGFGSGVPLTGVKVRIFGITAADSVCVARSGMVLVKGCI